MKKIPKIYFIVSLIVLISLLLMLAILLIVPDFIAETFLFIMPIIILLAPILFFIGLYLAFFLFRNDSARKSYIRWGIYTNLISSVLFFLLFSVSY